MIRLLLFFLLLALLAYAGTWLVQHPGHVSLDWLGHQFETSAALLILVIAVAAVALWIVVRVVVGLPSFVALAARQRRREKGYAALSRGLVAVGSGDAGTAARASAQASRHLKDDALAMMLEAQAAHLGGNSAGAVRVFGALAQREDTRVLGLRGLHAEASRRGDDEAARQFAAAAHAAAPLPWSAQAVLDNHANTADWEEALATVEASVAAKLVDRDTGERQRAVLETAIARDKEGVAPGEALALARAAIRRAPDLAPPVVIAARLLGRRGDIRKATKLIEKAWQDCQHPDIARAYLDVRPGDSTADRLARARTLMGIRSSDPVGRLTVARAALANTDHAAARAAMEPLVGEGQRPTVRMCLLMAEIEEAEHGDIGLQREWTARASHATLDPAWIADGTVYERWEPVSPTTGKLDAFRWQVPAERLGPAMDALSTRKPDALASPRRSALAASARAEALAPPPTLIGHQGQHEGRNDGRPAPSEPDVDASAAAELAVTTRQASPAAASQPAEPAGGQGAGGQGNGAAPSGSGTAPPGAVPAAPVASPAQPVNVETNGAAPPASVPADAAAPKPQASAVPPGTGDAAFAPPPDRGAAIENGGTTPLSPPASERRAARTYSSG